MKTITVESLQIEITKLTRANEAIEKKYLEACKENDSMRMQIMELQTPNIENIQLRIKLQRLEEKYQSELSISQGYQTQIRLLQGLSDGLDKPIEIKS